VAAGAKFQLKRVSSWRAWSRHCDFVQQETLGDPDGRCGPNLIVSLPNGHHVVVDAKVRWKPTWPRWMRAADEILRREHLGAGTPTKCARMCLKAVGQEATGTKLSSAPEFV